MIMSVAQLFVKNYEYPRGAKQFEIRSHVSSFPARDRLCDVPNFFILTKGTSGE